MQNFKKKIKFFFIKFYIKLKIRKGYIIIKLIIDNNKNKSIIKLLN